MNRRTPKQRHFTDFAPTNGKARFRLAVGVRRALPGAAARSVDSDAIAPDTEETDYVATVEHCTVCGCFLSVEVFQNARRATERALAFRAHPVRAARAAGVLNAAGEAKGRLPPAQLGPTQPAGKPQQRTTGSRNRASCWSGGGFQQRLAMRGLGRTSNRRRSHPRAFSRSGCMRSASATEGMIYEVNPMDGSTIRSFKAPAEISQAVPGNWPAGR